MYNETKYPRHQFHGHAVGFSGRLTRPFDVPVDAIASCSLPPSGGYASSRSADGGFHLRESVRIGRATSQVTGSRHEEEKVWNTVAISTIEDLDILGVITADRITAVLSVRRPFDGEPEYSLAGSRFENLRIGGERLDVDFDYNVERWKDDTVKQESKFELKTAPADFCIVTSAVSGPKTARTAEAAHILKIPHFGRVVLGEYWITPYSRTLTMFRAEMGCGYEGRFEGLFVGGNGVKYPPH